MDFLIGITVLGLLIPFNMLILKIIPKIHPITRVGMLYLMLFVNMVITLTWVAALHTEIKHVTQFAMGIGLATTLNMCYKVIYLLILTDDK
jgi:hypothetical protein